MRNDAGAKKRPASWGPLRLLELGGIEASR